MLVMNKYCASKWNRNRPAYTIRKAKYRRIEELELAIKSDSAMKEKSK